MMYGNLVRSFPLYVLENMFFFALSVVLWGASKGFGFGDEGIYLLASRYPEGIQQNVSAISVFTGYLFAIANDNPVTYRIIGVVLVLLSTIIFWNGFQRLLIKLVPELLGVKYFRLYSLFFLLVGAILHYQCSYLNSIYYTLTAIVVSLFSGLIFFRSITSGSYSASSLISCFFFGRCSFRADSFLSFPLLSPCWLRTFSNADRVKKSFVLLDLDSLVDIQSILGSVGINFPQDYVVLTRVDGLGKSFTLYKPNSI
ncbi:membrane hypothetical protein [Pseudomonas sp. IT-P12]